MKRVLIANKFYHPHGGDCVYSLAMEKLLREKGHEVAFFSMQHPSNNFSSCEKYFPSEINYSTTSKNKILKSIIRPLGSSEVKRKFNAILDAFRPDIVHLNNIHSQLSPIIAKLAHERNIKLVWTLHDYKLLCPRSDSLRQGIDICELCYKSKFNVLKYSCTKNSILASFLAFVEAKKWNCKVLSSFTDCFICPSAFMKKKMMQGGFAEEKLTVLNNFIDIINIPPAKELRDDYYCYLGRISAEKGVETLLEEASKLPYTLKVIGSGPLLEDLQKKYKQDNIEFLGFQNWDSIQNILSKARFLVIPSEWYENNPFSVIESLCLGTPILGARIGGIPELIELGINGMLFESGDARDLKEKITAFFESEKGVSSFDYSAISDRAKQRFSADLYYNSLMSIYEKIF